MYMHMHMYMYMYMSMYMCDDPTKPCGVGGHPMRSGVNNQDVIMCTCSRSDL